MDGKKANQLREEIREAVEAIAKRHGLSLEMRGGTYSATTFNPQLRLAELNEDGLAETPEMLMLRAHAPDLIGKKFKHGAHGVIELTGYRQRASRYPVMFRECETGKEYRAPRYLLDHLRKQASDA